MTGSKAVFKVAGMKHLLSSTFLTRFGPAASITTPASTSSPRALRDLPGPRAWPWVGNSLQVDRHRVHQQLEAWSRRYGPLMRVDLAGMEMMVVSDHAVIAAALKARPDQFRRPSRMQAIVREMGIADGVFLAEGAHWLQQRRMVMGSFAPNQIRHYFPALRQVTSRLQARWQRAADQQAPIDLQADLMRFTVDAVSGLAFGVEVDTLSSDGDVIQQHLDRIFPALWQRLNALVPYWRWVRLPRDRALSHSVRAVNEAIAVFMRDARVRLQDPARRLAPPNLLEAMLVAADEPGSGMRDADVAGNVFTMLLAGEDTTATSLSWMIYLLSRHPVAWQRARDEVDRVLGPLATWQVDDLARLDWLEACIHETMRLKPVGPVNVLEAVQDTELAGVHLPAGAAVMLLMRQDGVRESMFPHAQDFRPERWLGDGAGLAPDHARRVAMPFGAGPRICPGRYLAMLEIKLAAAMLLKSFDVISVDTPDGREACEHLDLTMVPEGVTMRLRLRA